MLDTFFYVKETVFHFFFTGNHNSNGLNYAEMMTPKNEGEIFLRSTIFEKVKMIITTIMKTIMM